MAKERKGQPAVIRLAGVNYHATVLKIVDHYPDGRVKTTEVIHDDISVDIRDPANRHFMIVYASEAILKVSN
jgi:hypothetical protein